jgi:hypothetical protein
VDLALGIDDDLGIIPNKISSRRQRWVAKKPDTIRLRMFDSYLLPLKLIEVKVLEVSWRASGR